MQNHYNAVVIGAGSGGIAAAIAAARAGLTVLLIEKETILGGTMTVSGVDTWEMGTGGTGLPFEIYLRAKRVPNGVGIYSYGRHCLWKTDKEPVPYPGGEAIIDPAQRYINTLQRCGTKGMANDETSCRKYWHGVSFEPDIYCQVVEDMLAETGNCTIATETWITDTTCTDGAVRSVTLNTGSTVTADYFIDATGDGVLLEQCGVTMIDYHEGKDAYDEPWAPDTPQHTANPPSLIYRVTRKHHPAVDPLPTDIEPHCWWADHFPVTCVDHYPNGDLNMNTLPTMQAQEYLSLSPQQAYEECRKRVLAHWHHNQRHFPEFQQYRICWIAPRLGIRESRRMIGRYVLTQHDLTNGLSRQNHPDIIALADHALDTHGQQGRCAELPQPYGIPYRCLIPEKLNNVLAASRGASFSALAASSCRLSRTMMQLGQAAGNAIALAKESNTPLPSIDTDLLRQRLIEQHVQLEWPIRPDLQHYIREMDPSE